MSETTIRRVPARRLDRPMRTVHIAVRLGWTQRRLDTIDHHKRKGDPNRFHMVTLSELGDALRAVGVTR